MPHKYKDTAINILMTILKQNNKKWKGGNEMSFQNLKFHTLK